MAEEPSSTPRGWLARQASRLLPLSPIAAIVAVAVGAKLAQLAGILMVIAVLVAALAATGVVLSKPQWPRWAKAVVSSTVVAVAVALGLVVPRVVGLPWTGQESVPAGRPSTTSNSTANQPPRLAGVSLVGANLRGADLRGANLRGADLRGVDFSGACLSGADLSGARIDPETRFAGADLTNVLPASLAKLGSASSTACET